MTIMEMLEQSAVLTVLGMTVVFVFLWIMIVCVDLTGKVIHRLGLDKDTTPPPKPPVRPAAQTGTSPEITAVIGAAVTEYRKTPQNSAQTTG
jgi:oxaloacetate decarboxylase gamma subunit